MKSKLLLLRLFVVVTFIMGMLLTAGPVPVATAVTCPECTKVAPDVWVCAGDLADQPETADYLTTETPLESIIYWDCDTPTGFDETLYQLYIPGWDPDVPGNYSYTLERWFDYPAGGPYTDGCHNYGNGMIHVVEACTPTAPTITICMGVDVQSALEVAGLGCAGDCYFVDLAGSLAGIDNATPGTYDYTVTCRLEVCDETSDADNVYMFDGDCCEASASGQVTVEDCTEEPECGCHAPPITVCQGADLEDQYGYYFANVSCVDCETEEEIEPVIDYSGVDTSVPGEYTYYVNCAGEVCSGTVTVEPNCVATAPDFSICQYTPVNYDLFVANGAECSDGCEMFIRYWGVRSCQPGEYEYTVYCKNPCGCEPDSATGIVTVKPKVRIDIVECPGLDMDDVAQDNELYGLPQLPEIIAPGTVFGIKAEIFNKSGILLYDVTPRIYIDGPAELKECPNHYNLGNMEPWSRTSVAWTLECLGPGDVDVTVWWENTPYSSADDEYNGGACSEDTCSFDQRKPAEISLTCESPCQICTDCDGDDPPGNEFTVTATVENTGQTDLTAVEVTMDVPANVTIIGPVPGDNDQDLGLIEAGDSDTAEWTVRCDGEGDAVFNFTATGTDVCTWLEVEEKTCQTTTYQRDVLVTELWAEDEGDCQDDLCTHEDACPNGCDPEDTITVSVGEIFHIYSQIKNCTGATTSAEVALKLPDGTTVLGDVTASANNSVSWGPTPLTVDLTSRPGYAIVELNGNFCDCCWVDMDWTLECTGSNVSGDPSYWLEVTVPDHALTYTSQECLGGRCVVQEDPIDLVPSLVGPYIEDCDSIGDCPFLDDCWVLVDAVAVCQEYDVDVCVTNEGEADAYDVTANITVSGDTNCTGDYQIEFGCIAAGETKCISLAEFLDDCELYCTGEDMAHVQVTYVEGYDENSCDKQEVPNPDCGLDIPQCDVSVQIVNPTGGELIKQWETYAVKALITNCGTCDLEDVEVRLMLEGDVMLVDENPIKHIQMVEAPEEDCEECCDDWDRDMCCPYDPVEECCRAYEVTWMVQCIGTEDAKFDVCVTSTGSEDYPEMQFRNCTTVQVDQEPRERADVCVDIVSPDSGSIYATSQEFAISAIITNMEKYAPITIDDVWVSVDDLPTWYHHSHHPGDFDMPDGSNIAIEKVVPEPEFVIQPGESRTITFTAHCAGSGLSEVKVGVSGESDEYEPVFVTSEKEVVWQYPASHLEVAITEYPEEPIVTSTLFDVTAIITNTGEADATEVYATLAVTPDGSVRVAGPSADGYTQYVGTIPGHGSEDNSVEVTWNLHCKVACDSTITVTATGNDEYGWHMKQECASTGSFIIEGGYEKIDDIDLVMFQGPQMHQEGDQAWFSGYFYGDANGLIGPFSATAPVVWEEDTHGPGYPCCMNSNYTGEMVMWGYVIPNVPGWMAEKLAGHSCDQGQCCHEDECDMIAGKDIMYFTGYVSSDTHYTDLPDYMHYCVNSGVIQVINGQLTGSYGKEHHHCGTWTKALLGGEYCSNMAATASRAIEARFIEPDSVTVKQLPVTTDLGITKTVEDDSLVMGEEAHFTIMVTNDGPSDATGVQVMDVLPETLSLNYYVPSQGWYDVTSGYWIVGDIANGGNATLEIWANVDTVGEVCNIAVIAASDANDPYTTNNMASVCIDVGEGEPVTQVSLDLDSGANLISIPLIPDESDVQVAWSGVDVNTVYMYDKSIPDWLSWINGFTPETGFVWEDGVGYWAYMNSADSVSINGTEMVSGATLPPSYYVDGGWNLIGFKSVTAKSPAEYLAGIEGKYVMIYGFDNGAFYAVGSPGHANLQPGHGYWIAVKSGEDGYIFP